MITNGRNRTIRTLSLGLMAGTMMSALFMATPAHAGFNWTPAPAPPKAAASAASGSDIASAPLTPVEADSTAQAPISAKISSASSAESINWAPATPPAAMPAATPPPAESASYKEVKGFGKDIPLAMAMNQIVPSDYAYSFAPEINPGTSINWQGDRPWNVVLNDALAPAGLVAVIDNNSVRIQPASDISAPAAPAPAASNAAAHYTAEQLAAIGMNSGNDNLHYQRHQPRDRRGLTADQASGVDSKAVAAQTEAGSAPPPPGDIASGAGSVSRAESEPMPLTGNTDQPAPAVQITASPISTAPADIHTVSTWQAARGQSLHDTLSAWCGQSGVNLIWQTNKDYKLPQTMDTKGTFTDAVRDLLMVYNNSKPRPVGQLHPNLPKGPPVLVIQNEAGV